VLADLRETSPDLILHGADLAHGGADPAGVVDQIRDLGWPEVLGNTDEMLFDPDSLSVFASRTPHLKKVFDAVAEIAAATRDALGAERIAGLRGLPRVQLHGPIALVHASPDSLWKALQVEAAEAEFEATYGKLGRPIAVYAHIHRPFIRSISWMTVVNTGSVSLSYDGDPRAAYLLVDAAKPEIRRVTYDLDKEVRALFDSGIPYADWTAKMLGSACFQMPGQ